MTCRECRDLMLEVARHRAAPFAERAVATHAAGCADCARHLERERSLSAGLRALASADAVPSAPDLEGRLAAAFAALHGAPEPQRAAGLRRGWLAAAAGLILAAGLTAWSTIGSGPIVTPGRESPTAATNAALPAGQPQGAGLAAPKAAAAGSGPIAALPTAPAPAASRTRRSTSPSPRASRPEPVEPAGFTAIPSAAGLPDFESGEIVRLDMPVTSLPNYGVELPADALSSSVQADLLVGQDGQPRAIRLVTAGTEDPRPRR